MLLALAASDRASNNGTFSAIGAALYPRLSHESSVLHIGHVSIGQQLRCADDQHGPLGRQDGNG
jgi:hypothetical protein